MAQRSRIGFLLALAALSLWSASAAIDAYLFHQGAFVDLLLFDVSARGLYLVAISIAALAMGGVLLSKGIRERTRDLAAQREREEAFHTLEERTAEFKYVNEQLKKVILYRKQAEEELRRSESFLNTMFDSIHDPLSIVDREYTIIKLNDAYARMRNLQVKDLVGKRCHEVLHNSNDICKDCVVKKTFLSADPCAKEKMLRYPDGSEVWFEIYTYPILDQDRNVSHVIEYTRDITDRKKAEEENKRLIVHLNAMSTTDTLTGLFNRRALNDILGHEIDRARRYRTGLSVILCDVDRFKKVNDMYGHTAGDQALQALSATLARSLRKADVLGRYGGDEFMIIMPETSIEGAQSLGEKIRAAVNTIELEVTEKKRISISISIGAASCCVPAEDIDTIVARADAALYLSKKAGRNKVSVVT